MTQCDRILDGLRSGRSLTPADAIRDYGCLRLAARIDDLRRLGYNIHAEIVAVPTRDGVARVARYSLDRNHPVVLDR